MCHTILINYFDVNWVFLELDFNHFFSWGFAELSKIDVYLHLGVLVQPRVLFDFLLNWFLLSDFHGNLFRFANQGWFSTVNQTVSIKCFSIVIIKVLTIIIMCIVVWILSLLFDWVLQGWFINFINFMCYNLILGWRHWTNLLLCLSTFHLFYNQYKLFIILFWI